MAWACIACTAAVLGHRWHIMHAIQLWRMIPVPFYGPWNDEVRTNMYYLWSASYLSMASHMGALSLGVLAYLALTSPAFMAGFARHTANMPASPLRFMSGRSQHACARCRDLLHACAPAGTAARRHARQQRSWRL